MSARGHQLLLDLERIVNEARDRQTSLEEVAACIRSSADYRWVGLYDVDHAAGLVRNLTWSGPGAPEHPTFPLTKGLTSAAVARKQTSPLCHLDRTTSDSQRIQRVTEFTRLPLQ
jgi:putative methionine-R-sulfoxide reductase with GAF domain